MIRSVTAVLLTLSGIAALAQEGDADRAVPAVAAAQPAEAKRLFWLIPNYRTSPTLDRYKPLTVREKWNLARQDAFDRGTVGLALLFGAEGLATNSNPSFGHGPKAVAKYLGASYADYAIGDFMTEAVFPTLLHQDPRYFRRGVGSGWSRLGYATAQIFITHSDRGTTQINYSEILGNSAAVAIGTAYYRDNRTATDAVTKLGSQLAVDAASNILKEFWPEISRKFSRQPHAVKDQSFVVPSK